ncbi:putative polyphosphate/ATP-dependent NAD kinase [Agromyces flavus]|uniref:Polyphosphate/ATP-dependent NAD kinase n=1 Tax=Agromyces flavus TaxID=589382 RepID=A0A1H1WSC8_9MICO|nr:NAD(+)/NADH kinase [Agromyces flavus]MCP2366244.1 putative polyphosphate/ATP-dependent NAD kinase [Agromyces flavus]GGI44286.1 ATP-NAD kinase [Agromyces flavus]SDT00137.1 Predicted polyphosphate-or ATP-dependent NAD kinase [Agromyces flavus]
MIGLIVNPVAGVGGPAGLGGSDGGDVQRRAGERGARPRATERAAAALAVVASARRHERIVTAAGAMGADAVRAAGLEAIVVWHPRSPTFPTDTTAAARALADVGVELVLFAGGDGTARDVAAGLPSSAVALGIPAGVKMYSPVFAVGPSAAGALAAAWIDEGGLPTVDREVLDVDEAQLRRARVEPRLYATIRVPYRAGRTQARKAATPADERAAMRLAARGAVSRLQPGVRYLLGPGGTMAEVARELGVDKTLLGVDVVLDGRVVVAGASEQELLDQVGSGPAQAIVSIIGGQGFLLGRGNQQLSARVLDAIGDDPVLAVAPEQKLIDLEGRPLLVDTGDARVDARLAGFVRVVTGPSTTSVYPVQAPENEGAADHAA